MSETQTEVPDVSRLSYRYSTHAPLFKRYVGGEFREVGESGPYGPVDPDTGAEYRALGGADHRYSRDFKVGSSYPKCGFILAETPERSLTHAELEAFLRRAGLWGDCLERVLLPRGVEHGEVTWWQAWKFTPVERSPRPERFAGMLGDTDPGDVTRSGDNVSAFYAPDE